MSSYTVDSEASSIDYEDPKVYFFTELDDTNDRMLAELDRIEQNQFPPSNVFLPKPSKSTKSSLHGKSKKLRKP